ncbi:FAD assembly factor SdhE [Rappaport israeli]|uniref:FAD assembly factor SdhE n=1 Tax=Rappaport israeli TaxID=1839807 RepID=UPI00093029B6|nr:succinate dehydrogenase assembly factor 2 [Rappaport israeli]
MTHSFLKWRCRRGMKELDLLLLKYLQQDYLQAPSSIQQAFARLLDYQDPVIVDLLFNRYVDEDEAVQSIIRTLQAYSGVR